MMRLMLCSVVCPYGPGTALLSGQFRQLQPSEFQSVQFFFQQRQPFAFFSEFFYGQSARAESCFKLFLLFLQLRNPVRKLFVLPLFLEGHLPFRVVVIVLLRLGSSLLFRLDVLLLFFFRLHLQEFAVLRVVAWEVLDFALALEYEKMIHDLVHEVAVV